MNSKKYFLVLVMLSPAFTYSQQNQNDVQGIQQWEISLLSDGQVLTTATMQCLTGGACDASAWTILDTANFGCTYKLDFPMQFSGTLVRLLLFHETLDSNCSNILIQQATGTGVADTTFPNARNANGEVTLRYQSPILTAGGTTQWRARRL
ncbi:MAG: hypothetical protein P8J61_10990 [Gammaproteobacteria bacterium]|jgi:hypothetical protein|nr:hypothetical protein [Gammaproteobacteria bacterium]